MNNFVSSSFYTDIESCAFKDSRKLLRLVATTTKIDELCVGLENLLWSVGFKVKCSFHNLLETVSNDGHFQVTFPNEWDSGRSESEIIGDLRLSKPVLIQGRTSSQHFQEGCNCRQLTANSVLLIPALSFSNGLSWIKMHLLPSQANLHISDEFIEDLQWAFFIHVERNLQHAIFEMSSASISLLRSEFESKASLTKRQNQIVKLVLEEMSNDEIGIQLHISTSLVKLELGKIFKILEVKSRKDLFPLWHDEII